MRWDATDETLREVFTLVKKLVAEAPDHVRGYANRELCAYVHAYESPMLVELCPLWNLEQVIDEIGTADATEVREAARATVATLRDADDMLLVLLPSEDHVGFLRLSDLFVDPVVN